MYIQIVGGRIYTPTGWIDGGSVLVEGKKIKAILNTDLPIEGARQLDARGSYIIPGGIEMHVHGAAGADYMDGTVEAFRTASDYHLQQGTTTIFPTLSTSSYETIMKGIECTEILMKDDESTVEGLHLEGPYFSVKMAGAQLPELIRPARPEEYTKIMERGDGVIKRWDAAPEIEGALDFGSYIRERGVVVALAHTEANDKHVRAAWEHGYTLGTHFYNAMKVAHKVGVYKEPGAVETILDMPDFDIEVICDGIHVPPVMVHLAYAVKGRERMALTTDALLYTGTVNFKDPTGHAIVEDGVCKLSDRSALAGSIATMDLLIRTAVQKANIPLIDAIYMCSYTPARIMGIQDTKGALEAGHDADILFLDEDLQLRFVMHRGRTVRGAEFWG
ncbi:MAG: N-acetylglucosamine-6-phosphate deacetylase [Porphyromonas sp.]|uniref:N-acetylglucosamine-6-phosphate deacetylase n=1 Tax=Porphyromonas sp. TaxID=1924944 RepID=UPI001CB02A11|nr:N-acetylglucosamine-6-phosphate deacetylase [Porphyromonas sp.]MBF1371651.1 N-acetylglucosamine-6-phosphate deacetylase [Porphyromonas sp.]